MKREIYTEEHDIFRDAFRKFLEKEVVPYQEEWLKAGIVPREIWKTTGEQGFISPWLPEEYGGAGADFLYSAVEIEEVARIAETGFALNLHGESIVPYIEAFGNEEQKKKWLPGCASGDLITAVAMTEPNAGSENQSFRRHSRWHLQWGGYLFPSRFQACSYFNARPTKRGQRWK